MAERESDNRITMRRGPARRTQLHRRRQVPEEVLMAGIRERMADQEHRRRLDDISKLFGDWGE